MVGEAGDEDAFDFDWDGMESFERADARTHPQPLPASREGSLGGLPRKPFSRWTADTERAFLVALRLTGQVKKAAAEIGRCHQTAYKRRLADPAFAARWDAAIAAQQAEWIVATQAALGPGLDDARDGAAGGRLTPGREYADGWDSRKRGRFLRTLARTKCVKEACTAAGVSNSAAYDLKKKSVRFARAWEKALGDHVPSVLDAARARAVDGWDEPIVRGGEIIGTRKRYSDGLLRDLLRHEMAGKGGRADPDAGRASEAGLTEAILKNLAMRDARRAREKAERQAAEWARAARTWGNWGRISAGEIEPEPPAPDPDAELDAAIGEEEDADWGAWADAAPETLAPG